MINNGFTVNCAVVPAVPAEALIALGVPAGRVKGEPLELDADMATWKVQVAEALIAPPDSDRLVSLALGANVAPHVFDAFGEAATVTPVGSTMLSATPEIDDVFGLVSVTVMVEVLPATIDVALSDVADVGAEVDGAFAILVSVSV